MKRDIVAIDGRAHPWSEETDELADSYRKRKMMAVLLVSDDSTTSGLPPVPNDHVAQAFKKHPDG